MTLILDTKFSFFQSMFVLIILFFMFPSVFNLYAEYIMRNAGLEEAQAGIKITRRSINTFRYADDMTLMAKSEDN